MASEQAVVEGIATLIGNGIKTPDGWSDARLGGAARTSVVRAWMRSLDAYTFRMNLYILPALGPMAISRLTKPQVMKWRDTQAA